MLFLMDGLLEEVYGYDRREKCCSDGWKKTFSAWVLRKKKKTLHCSPSYFLLQRFPIYILDIESHLLHENVDYEFVSKIKFEKNMPSCGRF